MFITGRILALRRLNKDLTSQDFPKRQINARRFKGLGFRHGMQPMPLACPAHDQQVAVLQINVECLFGFFVMYPEQALIA